MKKTRAVVNINQAVQTTEKICSLVAHSTRATIAGNSYLAGARLLSSVSSLAGPPSGRVGRTASGAGTASCSRHFRQRKVSWWKNRRFYSNEMMGPLFWERRAKHS